MTSHPGRRAGSVAVSIARHGRRFTGAVLIVAAVVGIGVGVAAPEISPVAPATVTAAAVPAAVDDTPTATPLDARTDRGRDGRGQDGVGRITVTDGGQQNAGPGRGGNGGRR
ncbi:hypothetical protein [Kineococcus rubinsiae]|uniref:hypothetical protein n=1 Tax=Kineococcus rubinsiae TaxID=2609562 RepID=UPI00142F51A9|nr:hypothetical protein [Kineococcus rubinsiae]NIZ92274.1 hypothetical protein [Kineococcus rubinsiae]